MKTRRTILDALKLEGAQEAGVLAQRLNLSAMAIRQHLYSLSEEGFVAFTEQPRPVGRPAKMWALTQAAAEFFPDAHAELTADILRSMRTAFGEDGLDRLIKARSQDQTRTYSSEVLASEPLADRVKALAAIRSREGYMAEAREGEGEGWVLIENHCPICTAAAACSGLCAGELAVFKAVLGPDVLVERTDHILAGARRCAYLIKSRA